MMFASFHSNGTTPSFNDTLNTLASGILICSTVSISNCGCNSIVVHAVFITLGKHQWAFVNDHDDDDDNVIM